MNIRSLVNIGTIIVSIYHRPSRPSVWGQVSNPKPLFAPVTSAILTAVVDISCPLLPGRPAPFPLCRIEQDIVGLRRQVMQVLLFDPFRDKFGELAGIVLLQVVQT